MTQNISYSGPKIALYQPDIPQNTAAIVRTCSCLGIQLEIIEPCGFFLTDPRFKRIVMDYMDMSSIKFYKSYEDFEKAKINKRVILATTKAKEIYTKFKFRYRSSYRSQLASVKFTTTCTLSHCLRRRYLRRQVHVLNVW